MTKADIVKEIANKTGIDSKVVLQTIEAFMTIVKEQMANEENIYLRGFGSFIIKQRAAKTARNISRNTTLLRLADKRSKAIWKKTKRYEIILSHSNNKTLCLTERKRKDIKCLRTNVKSVCARIVTRANDIL